MAAKEKVKKKENKTEINQPLQENPKQKYATRGITLRGKVVSAKAKKTAIVQIEGIKYVPKFERYKRTRSRLAVHVPEGTNVKEGDNVVIWETRKISKTKSFVITKVLGENQ
jgi:small subunit ribosomal protein S17